MGCCHLRLRLLRLFRIRRRGYEELPPPGLHRHQTPRVHHLLRNLLHVQLVRLTSSSPFRFRACVDPFSLS